MRGRIGLIGGVGLILVAAGAVLVSRSAAQPAPTAGMIKLEAAQAKLVQQLYAGKLERRALFAHPEPMARGAKIATWRDPSKAVIQEESAWFFFVDEQPGANWEHRASYVLVDRKSGAVRSVAATTPPLEMLKLRALNPAANTELRVLRKNFELYAKVAVKPGRLITKQAAYAVLVSGGWDASYNYGRYWNDLASIYKALKQKYGYTDDQIIVLYASGAHAPSEDLDGDGAGDIDFAATKANLQSVLATVKANIAGDGKFFFYSTNHGGQEGGAGSHDAVLYLWGDSIRDDELAALTRDIRCVHAVYVMEQCFSGGMMDDLLQAQTHPCTNPRVCVMTAANHDEPSWGCDTEGEYDEYIYHWTAAVFGKTPAGAVVNADSNHDGVVSMEEAHAYAKAHDNRNEHPTIGSCVTGACDTGLSRVALAATRVIK